MRDLYSNDEATAARLARDDSLPTWDDLPALSDIVDDYVNLERARKYCSPVSAVDFLPAPRRSQEDSWPHDDKPF
jgi:hypothetical protein